MNIKHIILVISAALASSTYAQQRSVMLHHNGEITPFSNLGASFKDAYNAAEDGDTIYLPGGTFEQPGEYKKSLRIYGAGVSPDSSAVTSPTTLSGNTYLRKGTDNFSIEGVNINGDFYYSYSADTIENISLKYMKINGNIRNYSNNCSVQRINVQNCVITSDINFQSATNCVVQNCVIQGRITNCNQNMIRNNMFLYDYYRYATVNGDNNLVTNNCSRNTGALVSGNSNICRNNMVPTTGNDYYGTTPIINNNYENLRFDTLVVNKTVNTFEFSEDYHFVTPEQYVGTDGTVIGIYGGSFAWKEGLVPSNPHIRKNESAEETDENGELQLNINVVSQ